MRESLGQVCHKRRWVDNIRDYSIVLRGELGLAFIARLSPHYSFPAHSYFITVDCAAVVHPCRMRSFLGRKT